MSSSISMSLSEDTTALAESLSVMMQKEKTIYRSCDYLHSSWPGGLNDILVTESDRMAIVEWCYKIIDRCGLDREMVAMAMEMVDGFLSTPSNIAQHALRDRAQFQLLAVTALYIAVKTNERVVLPSKFFAYVSQGIYSADEIEDMELSIFRGLSWLIYAPTSIQMARHILLLALEHSNLNELTCDFILDEVRFQTECAVLDYFFVTQLPSTVAVAAILNTLDRVGCQDRQAILLALLLVVNEVFSTQEGLAASKARLHCLADGSGSYSEDKAMSDTAPRNSIACHSKRELEAEVGLGLDNQRRSKKCARI